MNQMKTGALIKKFRLKKHMTQTQLAQMLNVSDKAVSKWECGKGCPDISFLSALAEIFNIDARVLLTGEIDERESDQGNMKKLRFYVCPNCGNIITATSEAAVTCCGSQLSVLEPRKAEEHEKLDCSEVDGMWYISSDHAMTKEHYVSFVAFINDSTAMICKQYPEWNLQATIPLYRSGKLIWYCTKCGLLYQMIR